MNLKILSPLDMQIIAEEKHVDLVTVEVGPSEGNFLILTEDQMRQASLFMIGKDSSAPRYTLWLKFLERNGFKKGDLIQIPINDMVYIFRKS
jgi:hypothetical protein